MAVSDYTDVSLAQYPGQAVTFLPAGSSFPVGGAVGPGGQSGGITLGPVAVVWGSASRPAPVPVPTPGGGWSLAQDQSSGIGILLIVLVAWLVLK